MTAGAPDPPALRSLVAYFLRLGTLGFGGPIALTGAMQRDLVEARRWFTRDDYAEGLALAQLAPGPLAAQVAIYLGWLRAGAAGATLVGVAFVLPSLVMVLVLSVLYVHFGELDWMQAAFYGLGPAVIAVMCRSAIRLARSAGAGDPMLWGIVVVNAVVTAWTGQEIVWLILASGAVPLLALATRRPIPGLTAITLDVAPWLLTGLGGVASWPTVARLTLYFGEAGLFVFGSGLAIVPYLHGGVVDRFQWLTERQFLDAVAVAMITPGPVVITVAFIGYLVAGIAGAFAAALGVFVPCWLFVVLLAPQFRRHAAHRALKALVSGVTAAACGAIAGAAVVLGRRSIVDVPTVVIFLAALAAPMLVRRLPEPLLILGSGLLGLALQGSNP